MRSINCLVLVTALLASKVVTVRAATITHTVDFDSFADGTLLSQHDTFFDALQLSTVAREATLLFGTIYEIHDGYFSGGRLSSPIPYVAPVQDSPIFFHAAIFGSFSKPVDSVSFDAYLPPYSREINFSGVDQTGAPFSVTWPDFDPDNWSFSYIAPPGGYLTGFEIRWAYDTGPRQISVDNITFTQDVPDCGSTAPLLVTSLLALTALRRLSRRLKQA